jgi:hypothetical protein
MHPRNYSPFFKLTCKILRYYLLALLGFLIVCLVSIGFGMFSALTPLLSFLGDCLSRVAVLIFCLMAIAITAESLRH